MQSVDGLSANLNMPHPADPIPDPRLSAGRTYIGGPQHATAVNRRMSDMHIRPHPDPSLSGDSSEKASDPAMDLAEDEKNKTALYENKPDNSSTEKRLNTFPAGQLSYYPSHESLAEAGFFYRGRDNLVKCFSCNGEINCWEPGYSAQVLHQKYFPNCAFIKEISQNRKLTEQNKSQLSQTARLVDEASCVDNQRARGPLTRAYHPKYGTKQERSKTFVRWPHQMPEKSSLVDAGFFYTGNNDEVKCFYCDGGLRKWEANDNPWAEHAKWFSQCEWLGTQKDESFIQEHKLSPPLPPLQTQSPPQKPGQVA